MVWVEKIVFGDTAQEIPERADYSACYDFNMFVQLKDGQVLAAGKGIGEKEKGIELYWRLGIYNQHIISKWYKVYFGVQCMSFLLKNKMEK